MRSNKKIFNELYREALSLNTNRLCNFKDGVCQAMREGKDKPCMVCSDSCNHFNGHCLTRNIACKVWTCPEIEKYLSIGLKEKQEEILTKTKLHGFNKYGLTFDELENLGIDPPAIHTSNKRLDDKLH